MAIKNQIQTVRFIKKEKAKKQFEQKIFKVLPRLFNSQASLAIGQQFLYKVSVHDKKPILITDQEVIEAYLADTLNKSEDDEYYFITTKEPNNQAIEALLNRGLDKAKESLSVEGEIKFSLKDLAKRRLNLDNVTDAEVVATKQLDSPELVE